MHNLAVLLAEDGGDGKPDYAAAADWFRKAAELGVRDSQFNLGVLYGRGLGAPRTWPVWLWFSLAAQQGDADAAEKRDEVAAKMDAKGSPPPPGARRFSTCRRPPPAANEVPAPPGGWDAKAAPQANAKPATTL